MSCEIEEIPSVAALAAIRDEWSELCDRSPRTTPFQRPEWLLPWLLAFRPQEPWLLAARREGRLAGLFLLFLYRNGAERILAPCGASHSDYLDVIVDPEAEDTVMAAFFDELDRRRDRWDVCDCEQLRPESPLLSADVSTGWRAEVEPGIPCLTLDLPETFGELRDRVSPKLFANLRYYRNRLTKTGEVGLETADAASRPRLLAEVLRLHGARWQARGEEGMLAEPAMRSFHDDVSAGFLARGALLLHALHLDGRPIAALYGFQERETATFYLHGFDPDFAGVSPGLLIIAAAMEEAIRRGTRQWDFLRGREAYKEHWQPKEQPTFRRRLRHG